MKWIVASAGAIALMVYLYSMRGDMAETKAVSSARSPLSVVSASAPGRGSAEVVSAVATAEAAASAVARGTQRAPTGTTSVHQLAADLFNARDWRAFALSARSRPTEGGYFYALYAAELCAMDLAAMPQAGGIAVAQVAARSGTVSPTLIAQTERFTARCATFAPGEAASMHESIKAAARDGRDPLFNAVRAVSDSLQQKDVAALRQALDTLMQQGDVLALSKDLLLARVAARAVEPSQSGAYWFDGRTYGEQGPDRQDVLRAAWSLAACKPGMPCELDSQMLLACMGGRKCSDNREAYVRQQLVEEFGLSTDAFERAQALAVRIREAVARREIDAFVR